ncbi:MAG: translocation/assembly module TamB [Cyclobacteriaceae bacterium]|nr:translocation/assembly module TamB [Cyclobacteriaceae bacterium]
MKKKNKIRLKNLSIQVVAILVINVLVILSFLQLSSVQTSLARMLARSISAKTGYEILVDKVDIIWLDRLMLENVSIKDLSSKEMITIKRLFVNYKFATLVNKRNIIIDHIIIDQPNVQLRLSDSLHLNITSFITSLKEAYIPKKKKNAKYFIISQVEIKNGNFSYNHQSRERLARRFDYNHFGLDSINLIAQNLEVIADTFNLQVQSLSAIETSTGLPITSFSTGYHVSNTQMKFNALTLAIGSSIIKDSMVFNYGSLADLNHFKDKVHISAHFDKLELATQDLTFFAPYFKSINDIIYLKGTLSGYLKDFNLKNFDVQFGKHSRLTGNASFEGLPNIYNTFIDLKINKSVLYKPDLALYISSASFNKYYPINSAKVTGSFTGYPKDFVSNASFSTSIGHIYTDLNLKLDNNPAKSTYSGSIKLKKFDIGKLINLKPTIGKTTLEGKIKGKGLTKSSADFSLESTIKEMYFNNYNYTNITTNAHFAQELFNGTIKIDDPNLQFETTGLIDLRDNKNTIRLNGELVHAQLEKLKIRKDTSSIAVKFNVNVRGASLDSIVGTINIPELNATNNANYYEVKNLELISEIKNKERAIVLYSDRVKLKLIGNFNLSSAFKDFNYLWKKHQITFKNQSNEINEFYKKYEFNTATSTIDFELELKNINPLLNLFDPLVYLSENTKINGRLSTGKKRHELNINFKNDTIKYNHNLLINNDLNIVTHSYLEDFYLNGNLTINSKKQILRSGGLLDSLTLSAKWNSDSINFNMHLRQQKAQNVNRVEGTISFKTDTTLLKFNKSQIQVLKQTWRIQHNNLITFTKDNLRLTNMSIKSGKQLIRAEGSISRSNAEPIMINIEQVNMNNLNSLVTNKLEGSFNGVAKISQVFTNPLIETNFKIDSFRVDGLFFGNIKGISNWNQPKNQFDVRFTVERNKRKLINIIGSYKPLGDQNALHLNANLMNTDLQLVEPFTNLFTNIGGTISGNITITGALFKPILIGNGLINNASFTIDYLKARLYADANWHLDSTQILLSNVSIKDDGSGKGSLDATFTHTNFKSFAMDLKGKFRKLKVLNTVSKENDYFYGTAIGTGNLSIKGPFSNLVISTRAKTEKGTKFYIPLSNSKGGVKQEDFISFKSFTKEEERKAVIDIEDKLNLKNVTINLDIEVTPEAYAEIIFDLTAGDIIRGNGKGNLSLGLDTKGKFTMLGEYEFTDGAYNFTMYNIINKEFKINPKSKITWSGDPYLANMDIDAVYRVNTSLAPIIDTVYQDLPEIKRIYPSKVLLNLDGPLLSPDIEFDIKIEDYPRSNVNIDTEVRAFLNRIHNDEQEMNRQVFSLLVFRKYSPPNAFSTGGTVGSSVSEFVSNQLSYWISQVDENLTIDFDLGNLDENALETFQLRVSYAFMDGKLIVTRDGGFTDQNQQTTLSSITGDWTVEYLLSKDGKLRIKLFKRTNYDQLSSSSGSNDELISGGFSLLYTTSFDSIKEVFNKNKKKKPDQPLAPNEPNKALKPEEEEGENSP